MSNKPETDQISFWRGNFGDAYTDRNTPTDDLVASRCHLWSKILANFSQATPETILEVGSNLGTNLRALKTLTDSELYAVEPNADARRRLIEDDVLPESRIFDAVADDLPFKDNSLDMVFTSGVLIHIHPDHLPGACREIHRVAARYIVCVEYFADKLESVEYGQQKDTLFKRDFGGFWLDNFPDLEVLDYGFVWKRVTRLDNLTWWVFEKHS